MPPRRGGTGYISWGDARRSPHARCPVPRYGCAHARKSEADGSGRRSDNRRVDLASPTSRAWHGSEEQAMALQQRECCAAGGKLSLGGMQAAAQRWSLFLRAVRAHLSPHKGVSDDVLCARQPSPGSSLSTWLLRQRARELCRVERAHEAHRLRSHRLPAARGVCSPRAIVTIWRHHFSKACRVVGVTVNSSATMRMSDVDEICETETACSAGCGGTVMTPLPPARPRAPQPACAG